MGWSPSSTCASKTILGLFHFTSSSTLVHQTGLHHMHVPPGHSGALPYISLVRDDSSACAFASVGTLPLRDTLVRLVFVFGRIPKVIGCSTSIDTLVHRLVFVITFQVTAVAIPLPRQHSRPPTGRFHLLRVPHFALKESAASRQTLSSASGSSACAFLIIWALRAASAVVPSSRR
jgi:hypothetical protein